VQCLSICVLVVVRTAVYVQGRSNGRGGYIGIYTPKIRSSKVFLWNNNDVRIIITIFYLPKLNLYPPHKKQTSGYAPVYVLSLCDMDTVLETWSLVVFFHYCLCNILLCQLSVRSSVCLFVNITCEMHKKVVNLYKLSAMFMLT